MLPTSANWIAITWFQSAPGREAGRCFFGQSILLELLSFQSAPGREAGRCSATVTY